MVEQIATTADPSVNAEGSTEMMGTLMHVQELFYKLSEHKDGPQAGKVNQDQFKEILLRSQQFDFTNQDTDLKTVDYMKLLDTDKDEYIGFFDFLQPILHVVPAEVITAFTQDQRFKQETFNDLRLAFDAVKVNKQGTIEASVETLGAKLLEKGQEQGRLLTRTLDQLCALVKHQQGQPLRSIEFHMGILRLEKRALLTFTSKLFQDEEVRLTGKNRDQPERLVPDYALKQTVATALDDDNAQLADVKNLLRQMQQKVGDLETRLQDYEDTHQTISPSQLPQTQSQTKDLWTRFRRCLPSFMDVVLDTSAAIHDNTYLVMSDDVQKNVINDQKNEIEHTKQFKGRYEKIVDQLASASAEEQKSMTPQTVAVINKNLLKQRNDKQKQLNQQSKEIRNMKNQNRVYKEFSDGKISKGDLKVIIDKAEHEQNELGQIKLRKVKVERIRNETNAEEDFASNEPKSMAQLLSVFGATKKKDQPAFQSKVTVLDEGNVGPGQAFKRKQRQQAQADGVELSEDSSAEEEVAEDEAPAEDEPVASQTGPQISFIQTMFDSQIKRKFEEDQAKSAAGLSAFKATGNPMQDAFRRMIEKKMLEKVQAELAKKQEEDAVFKREVEVRTYHREQQIEAEKQRLIAETEIKIKTANEARHDAEVQARNTTMSTVIQASVQTGLMTEAVNVPQPPSTPREAADNEADTHVRNNQMLIKSGQMAMTAGSMQAFGTLWANQNTVRFGVADPKKLIQDQTYIAELREKLMQLFLEKDKSESGILSKQDADVFLQEAYGNLVGQPGVPLSHEEQQHLKMALHSLDPTYEGFNLDDFIRAIQSMAAWQVQGRPVQAGQASQPQGPNKQISGMINSTFHETKAHLDQIRNEVEVQRLELLQERELIHAQKSELEYEKHHLNQEKQNFEANGAKLVAATAGQALLVEEEVKRRLKEEKSRQEYELNAQKQGGMDHDLRALQTFAELRERQTVNYENVTHDDALADAMVAADGLDKKKLLMRYKRLKQEVEKRDPTFTMKVMRNYFTCIRKVGTLEKKSEGFFGNWQQRFVVLSNAGMIYFKVDNMQAKEDLAPQNFKPLNDFVLQEVSEQEAKRPHCFRVIFCNTSMQRHPMLCSAPTAHDMREWINAFRMHQIDTMEARSVFFEKKLERSGVRVPRASILMTQGLNAPLQQVQKMARTQSAGPAQLSSALTLAPGRDVAQSMVAIPEAAEEEKEETTL